MKRLTSIFACLALLAVSACSSNDDAASGEDAGSIDSGTAPMKDAALTWEPDTSVGVLDGAIADSGPAPGCGNSTRDFFFSVPTPRCSAKTHDCALACEAPDAGDTDACRDACITADQHAVDVSAPWADCDACIFSQLLECGNQAGCSAKISDFFCCIEDKCPSGSAEGCVDAMCSSKIMDAVLCIYSTSPECLAFDKPFISGCFETMDEEDAGTPDGGK